MKYFEKVKIAKKVKKELEAESDAYLDANYKDSMEMLKKRIIEVNLYDLHIIVEALKSRIDSEIYLTFRKIYDIVFIWSGVGLDFLSVGTHRILSFERRHNRAIQPDTKVSPDKVSNLYNVIIYWKVIYEKYRICR